MTDFPPTAPRLVEPPSGDRRVGLRLAQRRPVKVFDPVSSRYVGGQTRDVSPTGLRLELPVGAPVAPGRLVHVFVGVADGPQGLAQRHGMIPARVVWVDRSSAPRVEAAVGRTIGTGAATPTMTVGVELVARAAAVSDAA